MVLGYVTDGVTVKMRQLSTLTVTLLYVSHKCFECFVSSIMLLCLM